MHASTGDISNEVTEGTFLKWVDTGVSSLLTLVGSRCILGGGGGVVVSTLPVKPGYTLVEAQMPKDDDKWPR